MYTKVSIAFDAPIVRESRARGKLKHIITYVFTFAYKFRWFSWRVAEISTFIYADETKKKKQRGKTITKRARLSIAMTRCGGWSRKKGKGIPLSHSCTSHFRRRPLWARRVRARPDRISHHTIRSANTCVSFSRVASLDWWISRETRVYTKRERRLHNAVRWAAACDRNGHLRLIARAKRLLAHTLLCLFMDSYCRVCDR